MPQDRIVPVQLVQSDELECEIGVSAFVESRFTDAGWKMSLVLIRSDRKLQARSEFRPTLCPVLPTPPPRTLITVELHDGVDDAVAMMRVDGTLFEAQFSRASVRGLLRFPFAEPRLKDFTEPHTRFYDEP